jgi:hypothetical protein
MNQFPSDEPYASYKKICTNLLQEYSKCILEKNKINSCECNDKLQLIQKWCMNPVGIISNSTIITPKE